MNDMKDPSILGKGDITNTVKIDDGVNLKIDSFDWLAKYELTKEEADMIADPEWIYKDLIIRGHLINIPAPPNGGKTTIIFDLMQKLASKGKERVIYVNADISGGDAKPMSESARACGMHFLTPDLKNESISGLIKTFEAMTFSDARHDDTILVIDTLKKFADMINKSSIKETLKMFRRLAAKGITVILLSHTNKYRDNDGNLIYEGVADVRSDVDELIFFDPVKNDDCSLTVTTIPDKVRGAFKPITFLVDRYRNVEQQAEIVDTHSINALRIQVSKDRAVIDAVDKALDEGCHSQKDINNHLKDNGISAGWRVIDRVLDDYSRNMTSEPANAPNPERETGLYWAKRKGVGKGYRFSKAL